MARDTNRWEDYHDRYRSDWETANPNSTWDRAEHGYRYGWESAQDTRWGDRSYSEVESDLQRGWSDYDRDLHTSSGSSEGGHAWDDFKDSVRQGWERAKQEFRERT